MWSTKAIVLSRQVFYEADCYIQFLTQGWGVITCLAKSARKSLRRYVGGLDLFCHDEIFIKGDPHDKPYLVELTVLNSFQRLRGNLDKLAAAGTANRWILKLANTAIPIPQIYSLLGQFLALLENEELPIRIQCLTLLFRLKLLSALGIKPITEQCTVCGTKEDPLLWGFDISSGGAMCPTCSKGHVKPSLLSDEWNFMNHSQTFKLSKWPESDFLLKNPKHLEELLTHFASFHTHAKLH